MTHPTRTCTVADCDTKIHARGYFQAHYRRFKKYGEVNADRPISTKIPEGQAWCPQCRTLLPLESFGKASDRYRGIQSYCLPCRSSARSGKYKDAIKKQQKRWRDANPEIVAEYYRNYASNNLEKRAALRRRLKVNNPALYLLFDRAGENNKRARKAGAEGRTSAAQLEARWQYYNSRCWMCGSKANETDHVKPLAKGGSGWPANLRPICTKCNKAKGDKWPFPTGVARGRPTPPRESTSRTPTPLPID